HRNTLTPLVPPAENERWPGPGRTAASRWAPRETQHIPDRQTPVDSWDRSAVLGQAGGHSTQPGSHALSPTCRDRAYVAALRGMPANWGRDQRDFRGERLGAPPRPPGARSRYGPRTATFRRTAGLRLLVQVFACGPLDDASAAWSQAKITESVAN